MALKDHFSTARDGYENSLKAARRASVSNKRASSSPYQPGGDGASSLTSDSGAVRQYAAVRDIPWTAIRPIAVSVANQDFKVGVRAKSRKMRGPRIITKSANAPHFIQKAIAEGIEVVDDHPITKLLETPNTELCGWANMWCTVISLAATGTAYWLIDGAAAEDGGDGSYQLWYLPKHWVRKFLGADGIQIGWRVVPPGTDEESQQPIPLRSIIKFSFPDPANPAEDFSLLQSQARAVNTDDELQKSQHSSMANGMRPGMVLVAGDLENPANGNKPQQVSFTPEQRAELVNSIRLAYRGSEHMGDPIILDGMIKDVYPYTRAPAELDFINGAKLTKSRIMEGIGTNPIVAGQVEGANRASAYVAQYIFFQNVVNPIITLISQILTMRLAPLFAKEESIYIWLDRAEAFDADLQMTKVGMLAEYSSITIDELREFADMKPVGAAKGGDKFVSPAAKPAADVAKPKKKKA